MRFLRSLHFLCWLTYHLKSLVKFFTARMRSCEEVMFSQACVIHSAYWGVSKHAPEQGGVHSLPSTSHSPLHHTPLNPSLHQTPLHCTPFTPLHHTPVMATEASGAHPTGMCLCIAFVHLLSYNL